MSFAHSLQPQNFLFASHRHANRRQQLRRVSMSTFEIWKFFVRAVIADRTNFRVETKICVCTHWPIYHDGGGFFGKKKNELAWFSFSWSQDVSSESMRNILGKKKAKVVREKKHDKHSAGDKLDFSRSHLDSRRRWMIVDAMDDYFPVVSLSVSPAGSSSSKREKALCKSKQISQLVCKKQRRLWPSTAVQVNILPFHVG